MLFVAIGLHALVDIPAAFYQAGSANLVVMESVIFVISLAVFVYSIMTYRNMKVEDEQETAASMAQHSLHQLANQRLKDTDSNTK